MFFYNKNFYNIIILVNIHYTRDILYSHKNLFHHLFKKKLYFNILLNDAKYVWDYNIKYKYDFYRYFEIKF